MNFFRSVFSDDPDPSTTTPSESESRLPEKSLLKDDDDDEEEESSESELSPVADSSAAAGAWSFGGLIKTLSVKSESVIETYRRDLQEFSSGLKKEIEVAQGSLETVGHAFDEFGSSVLKGTAEIIAQGKDAILAIDHESDSDNSSNQNLSNPRSSNAKPYSRFDAQVRSIQGDSATYCEEPEDLGDFDKWRSEFVLNDKSEEIENLLEENAAFDNIHKKVVPHVVDDETFWFRYFYKVHKLKQAENVRANLVKRAIASEEEEDLSWDVDDDEGYNEISVGSKGDAVKKEVNVVGETVKEENLNSANSMLKDDLSAKEEVSEKESAEVVKEEVSEKESAEVVKEDVSEKKSAEVVKKEVPVEELNAGSRVDNLNKSGGNVEEEIDGDKGSDEKDQGSKPDEKVAVEAKSDHGESSKDSDVSIVSTQPSIHEDEDLGWDEIEDLSIIEEKRAETQGGGIANREEMRKRLSTAEDDDDLDWGTDTE